MWKPNEDRVYLIPIPPEEKTESGIYKPSEAQKIEAWEVIAIGPSSAECKVCKTQRDIIKNLKVGMLVMINKEAGMDVEKTEFNPDFRVIRFGDIHGYDDKPEKK